MFDKKEVVKYAWKCRLVYIGDEMLVTNISSFEENTMSTGKSTHHDGRKSMMIVGLLKKHYGRRFKFLLYGPMITLLTHYCINCIK